MQNDASNSDGASQKDALAAADAAHILVSIRNKQTSCQHRTTSDMTYGARSYGLEMFGLGKNGRIATRTKEPVGNGTNLYHV